MNGHHNICPYTGLRSFTEEESLYFKGRDLQVDQITSLLEQNKFLMVTGASGEGKSSLIYAGLIPNARAGFFKAKYTNWVAADFRPERSPIHNMADALAKTFDTRTATIETELRRGYSSLIDLYTNSDFYIDEADDQWQQLEEPEKKERKRKAANLMIIVDQFEEFFTNPENFYNEAPSQDSQIVVNLVLETARIAIKRNIPVYVVCTMRSDYIGQCSAFRGLPEYIGFSQFFVPRLKRKDLKQVIEEPAILSGNRISQRLIERLVYDLADGVDQLPILQHALSQIWLAADHGRKEMDLIHYAMVGGMPAAELPDEEQPEFQKWFDGLPPVRQKYYRETGLNRVIEIHASVLYENAWEYYNHHHSGKGITQQDAKRIIALTFSCLTKIDNSRAVRNRMSLGEITGIINLPAFTPEIVSEVLSIYREDRNSFIRPFKTADPSTNTISSDTVLDITHESLIRNWNKLNTWANQEFEFYSTYLDLKKQLDRWKSSGKSSGFLLPIGPLTYFENWYSKCKPNIGWIKRYAEIKEDQMKAIADAEIELPGVKEFIKRSARKVAITRAFMKYGPQRIATVIAISAMLILSGYYWYDATQKQNSQVIKKVRKELFSLMNSKEVGTDLKAFPLLMLERHEKGSIKAYLSGLDTKPRFSQVLEIYNVLLVSNKHDGSAFKAELIDLAQAGFRELVTQKADYSFLITKLNKFTTFLAFDHYYNPSAVSENRLRQFSDEGYQLSLDFFRNKNLFLPLMPPELNYSIQQWLTFGHVTEEKINLLLRLMSPYEAAAGKEIFDVYYSKGRNESNGRINNDHSGGYHTLASLYAALGNTEKVIQCFDEIRRSGTNDYFTGSPLNNYTNIMALFYQYGYVGKTTNLVNWLSSNYPSETPLTIYKNLVNRSGYITEPYDINFNKNLGDGVNGYYFPNLCMASREVFNTMADDYEKLIQQIINPSERNYLMAINKKRRALFTHKYQYDRGLVTDSIALDKLLQQAVEYFRKVDNKYLDESVSITLTYNINGVRNRNYKRRQLFTYPDYMDGWITGTYHSDLFYNYIDKHNLYQEFYTTPEDLGLIHYWLASALQVGLNNFYDFLDNRYPLKNETITGILSLRNTLPMGKAFDQNLLFLVMANRAFSKDDTLQGLKYYQHFDKNNFAASRDKYEFLEKTYFLNQLKDLCNNLAMIGRKKEAVELAEKFEKDNEKALTYILMAEKIYIKKNDPTAFEYLDSAFSKSKRVDFSQLLYGQGIDFRFSLIRLLSRIGGRHLNDLSADILSGIIEDAKLGGIFNRVDGIAGEGNFYRATTALPSTLTEFGDVIARTYIIWHACLKKESVKEREIWAGFDRIIANDSYIIYQDH
jgi:energy-coupling factor transporter ATP-binding protein EcfA2